MWTHIAVWRWRICRYSHCTHTAVCIVRSCSSVMICRYTYRIYYGSSSVSFSSSVCSECCSLIIGVHRFMLSNIDIIQDEECRSTDTSIDGIDSVGVALVVVGVALVGVVLLFVAVLATSGVAYLRKRYHSNYCSVYTCRCMCTCFNER